VALDDHLVQVGGLGVVEVSQAEVVDDQQVRGEELSHGALGAAGKGGGQA